MRFEPVVDLVGIVRREPERAAKLAKGKVRIFEPMPGRAWKDYVQLDAGSLPKAKLAELAGEALDFTDRLPPKEPKSTKRAPPPKKTTKKKVAAKKR
jgi:hypothetical protein